METETATWIAGRQSENNAKVSDKTLINEWCSGKGKLMTKPALETGLNEDEAGLMHTAWPGGDGPHGSARVIGQPGVDRHLK